MTSEAAQAASLSIDLVQVVALLGAAVVAVPLFKKLGMGSVLGYLAAGVLVGPSALKLIAEPHEVLHTAELGVVMFLFVIGLEMEPKRLWAMRRQIFGLGLAQVALCTVALTGVGLLLGLSLRVAFIFGVGFVLTSTAIVMQVLGERGELATPAGERIISILLLEDLAIVPLLALVALLSPIAVSGEGIPWASLGLALGAVLLVVALGRWALNPLFRLLAAAQARELLTAAALLVVLGAAVVMDVGGLSMAMGAFLAGVLLSTSNFRHQLEADIEPFRGILLGLFFLAVGMSLDLGVIARNWQTVTFAVLGFMTVKGLIIYALARVLRASHADAADRAILMGQGGEFAFVLYTTAASVGVLSGEQNALFAATVIVSMILTPLALIGWRKLSPAKPVSLDGIEVPRDLTGKVMVIGFGRFGQIVSQVLMAQGCRLSIIDNDVDMIRAAATFGFKVYYGDGTRLDILHAAGIEHVQLVAVCTDDSAVTTRIVELLRHEHPHVKVAARAFDRGHLIQLQKAGAHLQLRELFDSSLRFGSEALRLLGVPEGEIETTVDEVRRRDSDRLRLQAGGGLQSGLDLLFRNAEQAAREQREESPQPSSELSAGQSAPLG